MAVEPAQLRITSPCPITLDRGGVLAEDRALHCGHCDKQVHLLSHMTEAEARAFMAAQAGADICVSYAVRPDGRVQFRPEPALVPASALGRGRRVASPLQRSLAMAASIGAAAWISACTPHAGEGEREREARTQIQTENEPPIEQLAGGMIAEPIDLPTGEQPCDPPEPPAEPEIMVEGGLKAEPLPEPEPLAAHERREVVHKAGGLRAKPVADDPRWAQDP